MVYVTLRQAGNSSEDAFAQFGMFEAMILPTLFFPSTILCALAGLLVTETARAQAAGRQERIIRLTERTMRITLCYAILISLLLIRSGSQLGEWLGGGAAAGRMLRLLAPVVPFIYLEIVLESIIKGVGAQAFSSLNYLAEYAIRIAVVLVCIPLMGFRGLVLSYYASNIAGNLARICLVCKRTGLRFQPVRMLGIPLFAAVLAAQGSSAVFALLRAERTAGLPAALLDLGLCTAGYLLTVAAGSERREPKFRIAPRLDFTTKI